MRNQWIYNRKMMIMRIGLRWRKSECDCNHNILLVVNIKNDNSKGRLWIWIV